MINQLVRKASGLFLSVFLLMSTASLWAGEGAFEPYNEVLFNKYQSEGKTIVVDVHAKWCGTCRKQKTVLDKIVSDSQNKDCVGLTIDYDNMSPALKQKFSIRKQSTVIVFKGNDEVARSIAQTDKDKLQAMIDLAQQKGSKI